VDAPRVWLGEGQALFNLTCLWAGDLLASFPRLRELALIYSSAGSSALITNGSEDSSMQELQR
jgi:hypothetical protein